MGFALAWVAVKGRPVSEILSELRLRPTGVRALEGEMPFVGALLGTGWYLIVMPGGDPLEHYEKTKHPVLAPSVLARLSSNCEVMTCTVEEHVMFSQATGWRDGERVWTVTHEPLAIDEEGTPQWSTRRYAIAWLRGRQPKVGRTRRWTISSISRSCWSRRSRAISMTK